MKTELKAGHLFLFCRVWGSRHGGSIYSRALVDELARKGWRITLVAETFHDRAYPAVQLVAFFRRSILLWPRKTWEIFQLLSLILSAPGAVVLVQGDLPRVTYLLLQLMRPVIFMRQDGILTCPGNNRFLARSRSICRAPAGLQCLAIDRTEYCLQHLSGVERFGRMLLRARDQLLLSRMVHFVTLSQYLAHVHRRPAYVLYPPRPAPLHNGAVPRRELNRITFCARLETVKGAAEAIGILCLLPEWYHLDVVGDGPERGHLGKLVEDLQLGSRVKFHGWLTGAARDQVLATAGVLLMPSLWDEAFGMAGLEALAQGTPVVAYDVGGISEWCRDGAGVLVPCGDLRRAAVAVRDLTDNPARWAAHSEAAQRVAAQFPTDRFGQELDQLLAQTIQQCA